MSVPIRMDANTTGVIVVVAPKAIVLGTGQADVSVRAKGGNFGRKDKKNTMQVGPMV